MDILFWAHFLNGFLMIAMPIVLGIYLARHFKLGWRLWWIGAATFVLSQVGHIPFNWVIGRLLNQTSMVNWPQTAQLIFNAVFGGLSAGLFEESFRYGMYRWWAKHARSWGKGLLAGAGHGGIEAILLGALALYGFIQLVILRNAETSQLSQVVGAGKVEIAQAQITAYWSAPWTISILGAVERFFAIPFQLALSLLVLQAFTRRQGWWVWLAIGLHALGDGVAVYLVGTGFSAYAIEGAVGLFAILSIIIIFVLRQPEKQLELEPAAAPVLEFNPKPIEETQENLEKTRYQ